MSSTLEEQHSGVGNLDGMEEGEEEGIQNDLRGKVTKLMECQSNLESAQIKHKATQQQLTNTQAELEITKHELHTLQGKYSSLESDYESLLLSCQSTRQGGQESISNESDKPNVVPESDTRELKSFLALDSITDEISQEDQDMEALAVSGMEEVRQDFTTDFQIPEYTSRYDSPHTPLAEESQLWDGILHEGMLKNLLR
jgi:chromosome segregation ATPase